MPRFTRFLDLLRQRRTDEFAGHGEPRFHLQTGQDGVERMIVRGPAPNVADVVLKWIQGQHTPLGIVLVDYAAGDPREWVAEPVPRRSVLAGLLMLRDLLGDGGFDLALHAAHDNWELILDRWGVLEVRAGSWNEPRLRSVLAEAGFTEAEELSALPPVGTPREWTPELWDRVREVREQLALERPTE